MQETETGYSVQVEFEEPRTQDADSFRYALDTLRLYAAWKHRSNREKGDMEEETSKLLTEIWFDQMYPDDGALAAMAVSGLADRAMTEMEDAGLSREFILDGRFRRIPLRPSPEAWEAEAAAAAARVTMKAGEYYVGDPCFAILNEEYDALLEVVGKAEKEGTGMHCNKLMTYKGAPLFAASTAYGDGEYPLRENPTGDLVWRLPVESGMIACISKEAMDLLDGDPDHMVRMFFDEDFEVGCEWGIFQFGDCQVNTGQFSSIAAARERMPYAAECEEDEEEAPAAPLM